MKCGKTLRLRSISTLISYRAELAKSFSVQNPPGVVNKPFPRLPAPADFLADAGFIEQLLQTGQVLPKELAVQDIINEDDFAQEFAYRCCRKPDWMAWPDYRVKPYLSQIASNVKHDLLREAITIRDNELTGVDDLEEEDAASSSLEAIRKPLKAALPHCDSASA